MMILVMMMTTTTTMMQMVLAMVKMRAGLHADDWRFAKIQGSLGGPAPASPLPPNTQETFVWQADPIIDPDVIFPKHM